MVGKPNVKGTAKPSAAVEDALDQEREASMADEGGAAGAEMEKQEPVALPGERMPLWALAVGAAAAGALALTATRRRS